jgi:hypothetical protein
VDCTDTNLVFRKISSSAVCCPRATTATRLVADALISPGMFFLWGNLTVVAETRMSKKLGIWAVGLPISAMLNWCKRAAGRYRRLARRIAYQIKMLRRRKQFEATQVIKVSPPFHADFAGSPLELREFTSVLSVGDRIRVLCDDGVLVAEKISETQFRIIHAQTMTELVH